MLLDVEEATSKKAEARNDDTSSTKEIFEWEVFRN